MKQMFHIVLQSYTNFHKVSQRITKGMFAQIIQSKNDIAKKLKVITKMSSKQN
jgi:hypothetical protein